MPRNCLGGAYSDKLGLSGAFLMVARLFVAKLTDANLNRASLLFANLQSAKLVNANLEDANLGSADFEKANLEKANISGANIYNIKTLNWKISDIQCTHVYKCPDPDIFEDLEKREKYRRNFKPGEFETFYKTLPKIELIFQQGFSTIDHKLLVTLIENINQALPSPLTFDGFKNSVSPTVTLTAKKRENLEEAAPLIDEMYQKIEEICQRQKLLPGEVGKDIEAIIEKKIRENMLVVKPDIYVENARFGEGETSFFHSPDYRSVSLNGHRLSLTGKQAGVIEYLHKLYKDGTPEVSQAHILVEVVENETASLKDVFKNPEGKKAYKTLIAKGKTKGTVRLNITPQ